MPVVSVETVAACVAAACAVAACGGWREAAWAVAGAARWACGVEEGETWPERAARGARGGRAAAVLWAYLCAAAARAAFLAWRFLALPSDLVGRNTDPWTGTDSSRGREKLAGQTPPDFPRGWFRVADSVDVPAGARLRLRRFGRWVDVSRGAGGGPPAVADDGGGAAWPVREANGHVYAWHALPGDPAGEPPAWEPLRPEELRGAYTYHGRSEHTVSAHVCEIPENGADVAHLPVLHRDFIVPALQPVMDHKWDVSWRAGKAAAEGERREFAYVHIGQAARFLGRFEVPGSRVDVDITQQGLGIVALKFATPFGFVYVLETVTPVEPLLQLYHHIVWAEWRVPRAVAKGVLHGLLVQAERDVPIWNHKSYVSPPLLVRGDGPIAQFRRWSRQFFVVSAS